MYVLTQRKHYFIPKIFLKWMEVLTSMKKVEGEQDDAENFDDDKEDHYNLAELAEGHEKTKEKEKQTKPKKCSC